MFGWTTGEPVRWVARKFLKFMIKKKLGSLILGDIDLNQLDIQLREGVLQLNDLALNVDYLNDKLGFMFPLMVKEGSIGSLLVKLPWNGNGCHIEVDEAEIVLAFDMKDNCNHDVEMRSDDSGKVSLKDGKDRVKEAAAKVATDDIHEGVKTIANIIRIFLSSFQVIVKRLLVAVEPNIKELGRSGVHRTLVLRISEVQCGTCVSGKNESDSNAEVDNFMGISRLTNFVKFDGGILELLQLGHVNDATSLSNTSDLSVGESVYFNRQSATTWLIVSGKNQGVSGSVTLSIPWKNGSLDIRTLDAEILVDPIDISLRPSTITWFYHTWKKYEMLADNKVNAANSASVDSVYFDSASHFLSALSRSSSYDESVLSSSEYSSLASADGQEKGAESMLREARLIPDWVTDSCKQDGGDDPAKVDLGASIDQFFECFDELLMSQSVLGASGMWNWTCSVFNVVNAASNLASGSVLIAPEQQHVETNLKAALAGVSVVLSFHDDDQDKSIDPQIRVGNLNSAHCLVGVCKDVSAALQVCPQELRFEGSVKHLEITDFIELKNYSLNSESGKNRISDDQTHSVQHLHYEVLKALSPSLIFEENPSTSDSEASVESQISLENLVKIKTFKTFEATQCRFNRSYSSSSKNVASSLSLFLELPPFICWLNFLLVNQLLKFFDDVDTSIQSCGEELKSLSLLNKGGSESYITNTKSPLVVSTMVNCRSDIVIPFGRVVLCFSENSDNFEKRYISWNQFLALDICGSTMWKQHDAPVTFSTLKDLASSPYFSLCFHVADSNVYLVRPSNDGPVLSNQTFVAEKLVSACPSRGCRFSTITIVRAEAQSKNLKIVKRAKSLVTREHFMDTEKCKNTEFVSATTPKDMVEINSRFRRDIILSSSYVLHINLGSITLDLSCSLYSHLQGLLDQISTEMLNVSDKKASNVEDTSLSQFLLLAECRYVDIILRPEMPENIRTSSQSELSGWWQCLKLSIQQLDLLNVSNLGDRKVSLFWLAHGEGKLCGSISGVPENEFLLISCSSLTRNRGDGTGSTALYSKPAGLDFIYLKDYHNHEDFTSISVGCTTIVAVGGHLDWLDAIISFFPVSKVSESVDGHHPKVKWKNFFVIKLTDVGLSYEPYKERSICNNLPRPNENGDVPSIACLLAASSFALSCKNTDNDVSTLYNFQVQDLALLLSPNISNMVGLYSVEHLHEIGYIKVVWVALLEVSYRRNYDRDHTWELQCSKSDLNVETCHDTAQAFVHLVGQLQLLVAPDMEELVVPLQTRWNNHVRGGLETEYSDSLMESQMQVTSILVDETCEDINRSRSWDVCESDETVLETDKLERSSSLNLASTEGCYFPELIESYCISERHTSCQGELLPDHKVNQREGKHGRISDGWYGGAPSQFVENHIYEASSSSPNLSPKDNASSSKKEESSGQVSGILCFTNMNVTWKMYAGSEWLSKPKPGGKDFTTMLELSLSGIQIQCDLYPEGCPNTFKFSLSVSDFYLYDKSKNAPWKLILGYYHSKDRPRETCSKMLKLLFESVRPDPLTPLEEYKTQVFFLPLLLHLQQSQLDFLVEFFSGGGESDPCSDTLTPIGTVVSGQAVMEEALLPYFQKFEILPFVLRVDYHPSTVDLAALSGGKYVELINLVPWKGVELQFKHAQAVSVYGLTSACETVLGEWLEDISQNQIHKILQGLPTIRSLVAVGTGATKLVSLPVESYKKDRKVIKGVQRGTIAFLRSISIEAVGLGVHLAANAHDILFQAEHILSKVPQSTRHNLKAMPNVRYNQPKNATQGMKKAYESLSDGLGKSASALVRTPLKKYQRGESASSALKTAVQAVPAAAIAPVSACASAAHYVLLGVRNSLDPEHKKESLEKYMGPKREPDRN